MPDDVKLIYIADVFCPWCYGFGPIMRRIAEENPQFPVKVIGGNLISRPITLEEDVAQSPDLVEFWQEVERVTGRSLEGAINAVRENRQVRLYSPGADEILTVLKAFAPDRELEQILYLEDMFYGRGLDMFTPAALDGIARDWNIRPGSFEKALDQPAALASTENNLREAAELMGEITSYPSVLLQRGSKVDAVSRGYVHYETVAARLRGAMDDLGLEPHETAYCSRHQHCSLGRMRPY